MYTLYIVTGCVDEWRRRRSWRFVHRNSREIPGSSPSAPRAAQATLLGLSSRQVRVMILTAAAHITISATLSGLILGIAYGWIAAQSLLGFIWLRCSLVDRLASRDE